MFVEMLVRARPQWILERLEIGKWKEDVWKEAFERRFLPSWKRFKGEGDTWRAIFLRYTTLHLLSKLIGVRTLGRLEHRNLDCTHEESWTVSIPIRVLLTGS